MRIWIRRSARWQVAGLIGLGALLALGLIRGAQGFLKANGSLTGSELGNLTHPLNPLQVFGIWPAGDFRVDPPNSATLAGVLIGVVIVALLAGLFVCWRRRWWLPVLYLATAAAGALLVSVRGSPWVQGKAFATISPAALLVGLAGASAVIGRTWSRPTSDPDQATSKEGAPAGSGRGLVAVLAATAIAFGVVWSNVLAYHHVTLAPYGQLKELSEIGHRFAGDGPAMLNEYEPYAVRHFLRDLDPESPSELRYRVIPLLGGQQVPKGGYADLDQFELPGLLVYRTIVTRTSPAASRPPAPYKLVYDGRWYQVWQRPAQLQRAVLDHLPLGNSVHPTAVPACRQVLRLGREAGQLGLLAAVQRPDPSVAGVRSPLPTGDTTRAFVVRSPGVYQVWLGGSFARRVIAYVDRVRVGSSHEVINEAGGWTPLGSLRLAAGAHRVTLAYGDAELYPGSGGPGAVGPTLPVGPVALAPGDQRLAVSYFSPARARSLCGRRWDWIEALGPPAP